jgi:hypothetical protein
MSARALQTPPQTCNEPSPLARTSYGSQDYTPTRAWAMYMALLSRSMAMPVIALPRNVCEGMARIQYSHSPGVCHRTMSVVGGTGR